MILPDQAAKDLEPQWFEEGENIRVADAFVIDIMLNANDQTYETLRRYSTTLDLDGIPIRTVNLEGLLLTKQPICESGESRPSVRNLSLQAGRGLFDHRRDDASRRSPDGRPRSGRGTRSARAPSPHPDTDGCIR
jgi:hypothetical protein